MKVDIEFIALGLLLIFLLRTINTTLSHPFFYLISTTICFVYLLIIGWKVASCLGLKFFSKNDNVHLIILSLTPILTIGLIWLLWMILAVLSVSHISTGVLIVFLVFSALPPKLNITRCMKIVPCYLNRISKKDKLFTILFMTQFFLLLIITIVLINSELNTKFLVGTSFDGLPWFFMSALIAVLVIPLLLISRIRKYDFSFLLLLLIIFTSFLFRAFLIGRGAVYWGYDDWFHVGASNFLLNNQGNYQLFNFVNWGYGSTFAMVLHSNAIFLSTLLGQPLAKITGSVAIAISWSVFSIGSYTLCKALLRSNQAILIGIYLLLFQPSMIIWSMTLTPNSLIFSLTPTLLCLFYFLKFDFRSLLFLFFCSIFLSIIHGFGLLISILLFIPWLLVNVKNIAKTVTRFWRLFLLSIIVIGFLLLTLLNYSTLLPFLHDLLGRLLGAGVLSLPFNFGINTGGSSILQLIQNPIGQIFNVLIFLLIIPSICFILISKLSIFSSNKYAIKIALLSAILILIMYIVVDLFIIQTIHLFSPSRLVVLISIFWIPLISSLFGVMFTSFKKGPTKIIFVIKKRFYLLTINKNFRKIPLIFLLIVIVIASFVSIISSYPSGNVLVKTMTLHEYELLSSIQNNFTENSLILGPTELHLYVKGMCGSLSPINLTVSNLVWRSYQSLISGDIALFLQETEILINSLKPDHVYVAIFNRWGLFSEVTERFIQKLGSMKINNTFGYIIELNLENNKLVWDKNLSNVVVDDNQTSFWVPSSWSKGGMPSLENDSSIKRTGIDCLKIIVNSGTDFRPLIIHKFNSNQDWSTYDFISLDWYGVNSTRKFNFYLYDDVENYCYFSRVDNFFGWQQMYFNLNKPNVIVGNFSFTSIRAIYILLPDVNDTFYIDAISLIDFN